MQDRMHAYGEAIRAVGEAIRAVVVGAQVHATLSEADNGRSALILSV